MSMDEPKILRVLSMNIDEPSFLKVFNMNMDKPTISSLVLNSLKKGL